MKFIIFFAVLSIVSSMLSKRSKEKSYDLTSLYVWFLYTISYFLVLYKTRNIPIITTALVVALFLDRRISTPIDCCINSSITLFTKNNYSMHNMSKNIFTNNARLIENLSDIPKRPTIWILNYPMKNWIEYYTQSLLPQNCVFFVNEKIGRLVENYHGKDRVELINLTKKLNYQLLKKKIQTVLDKGVNVCLYFDTKVEYSGMKRHTYTLQTPRNGVFNISKDLKREITPIVMDHLYISNGIIPFQNFEIKVGNPLEIKCKKDIDDTVKYFKNTLRSFMTNKFRV